MVGFKEVAVPLPAPDMAAEVSFPAIVDAFKDDAFAAAEVAFVVSFPATVVTFGVSVFAPPLVDAPGKLITILALNGLTSGHFSINF